MKCRYIEGSKNGPVTGPFGHGPVTGPFGHGPVTGPFGHGPVNFHLWKG